MCQHLSSQHLLPRIQCIHHLKNWVSHCSQPQWVSLTTTHSRSRHPEECVGLDAEGLW
jgi:hypothetical protein